MFRSQWGRSQHPSTNMPHTASHLSFLLLSSFHSFLHSFSHWNLFSDIFVVLSFPCLSGCINFYKKSWHSLASRNSIFSKRKKCFNSVYIKLKLNLDENYLDRRWKNLSHSYNNIVIHFLKHNSSDSILNGNLLRKIISSGACCYYQA